LHTSAPWAEPSWQSGDRPPAGYSGLQLKCAGTILGSLRSRSNAQVGASPLFCWARLEAEAGRETPDAEEMELGKIRAAAERVAGSLGMEVVDVEWKVGKQRFLRVYIDKLEGPADASGAGPASALGAGVSHKDCQAVSEQLSVVLDVEELVPGPRYILEISSPGLDRKLLKPADYERFSGRRAKVWTNEPVENTKYLEGRLRGYADGMVKIEVKDHEVSVPIAGIRKAQLVVEI